MEGELDKTDTVCDRHWKNADIGEASFMDQLINDKFRQHISNLIDVHIVFGDGG